MSLNKLVRKLNKKRSINVILVTETLRYLLKTYVGY